MKRFILLCLLQVVAYGCAQHPMAKITVHAVNQDGYPITDYNIQAAFEYGEECLSAFPDKNGFVTFKSPALTYALFSMLPKFNIRNPGTEKYYHNIIRYEFTNFKENVIDGKWQPWNPTIELVLKERLNPIPMYATSHWNELKIPLLNAWCGFDMVVNDWVSPYGSGSHADIEVFYQWDGFDGKNYHGSTLEVRFPDEKAGYYTFQYPYNETHGHQNSFISPYHAATFNTFNPKMSFSDIVELEKEPYGERIFQHVKSNHMKRGTGYIFRTRTRLDENGNLIGAHYGKIYPPDNVLFRRDHKGRCFLTLRYYLNPTENDTNLEYDPKHNLFMDKVKPSERWKYQNIAP